MGQEVARESPHPTLATQLVEAAASAIQRVVGDAVSVSAEMTLAEIAVDSLGVLEALVHMEDLTGFRFDEAAIRAVALESEDGGETTVRQLALSLLSQLDDRT